MADSLFSSCLLKVGRAEEHIKAFESEFSAWNDSKPCSIIKERDAEGGCHVFVDVRLPPPIERWSLLAGDCIHNLRSALDHMVYAFAIRDTGVDPPLHSGQLQFPIADTTEDFDRQKGRYKISTLNDSTQSFIKRKQPFSGKDEPSFGILSVLRSLNNSDKHRLLSVVFQHVGSGEINITPPVPGRSIKWFIGPIKSRTEVACFTSDPAQLDVNYTVKLSLNILVHHITAPNGSNVSPLGGVLREILSEVNAIVRDAILS